MAADSDIPTKISTIWAASASSPYIRPIPIPSQIPITTGAASFTDGFPPATFLPVASGGVPPFGADFNGILNQTTAWIRWFSAGGPIQYDATFQSNIGGYPKGSIVASAVTLGRNWQSTTDNNVTNPDASGAGWTNLEAVGGVLTGTLPNPGMASGAAATNVGALGGVLTGTLPNPTMASGAAAANIGTLSGVLSGTLPSPGMAAGAAATNVGSLGGVLSGTLPNPGMAAGAAATNVGSLGGSLAGTLPNPSIATSVNLPGAPTAATAPIGTSTTQLATTAFAVQTGSFGSSGFQFLASGLLLQWTLVNVPKRATTVFNFPIAFPTICIALVASTGAGISTATNEYGVGAQPISASQFEITLGTTDVSGGNIGSFVFAIGF